MENSTKCSIFLSKYKTNVFSLIKIICFTILCYFAVLVTFDYLSYPYVYKLNVSDNKHGFDFPNISICTERDVFFDKQKIQNYFNLFNEFNAYKPIALNKTNQLLNQCLN